MVSSPIQSSRSSVSIKIDQPETSIAYRNSSIASLSEFDLIVEYSFTNKLESGMKWLLDPFKQCCTSDAKAQDTSKNPFDSECLRPEDNQVNGLLKYFAFGVMFTNSM